MENGGEYPIHVSRVSLVTPAKPTPPHVLYMSCVDQLLRNALPLRTILFYPTSHDPSHAVALLRQALPSALVPFYPVAGRLQLDHDTRRLALHCNDHGLQFIEASCAMPFERLRRDNFAVLPFSDGLVAMGSYETSGVVGEPVASMQVTSFVGGLTLGFAMSHAVGDGLSFWAFLQAVAEICQGKPLSVPPLHARSLLKPETMMLNKMFPAPTTIPIPTQGKPPSSDPKVESVGSELTPTPLPSEPLQPKVFQITPDMLQTLKLACLETTKPSISSFEALAAYLWKRFVMASNLEDHTKVVFRVPLDIRNRIIPPLTSAFFGNAVVGAAVPATVGELKTESVGATAVRFRCELQRVNDSFIKKTIVERETFDLRTLISKKEEVVFILKNARYFPVFQAGKFGWGDPEAVRPPWHTSEYSMTWYPSKTTGAIDVIAPLSTSASTRFFSPDLYPNDPLLAHHDALLGVPAKSIP